jgi:hypothetical protein
MKKVMGVLALLSFGMSLVGLFISSMIPGLIGGLCIVSMGLCAAYFGLVAEVLL